MTKQHRMLGLNITLISFNFFVWLFGYFECAAPDVFALLHTEIIIQIKLLCTEDHDKSVSTSEHFQANHDEQTQKLCWGWTVRWKITIQGRKWKSKVCDYSTYYSGFWFCFWHSLMLTSQNFCSMVFNISVTGCVASHLNLCLRHVAVPNSLVSLHKAVHGVQDGQSNIDFSSFWRPFPDEVPWRQVISDAGTNLWESTIFPEEI